MRDCHATAERYEFRDSEVIDRYKVVVDIAIGIRNDGDTDILRMAHKVYNDFLTRSMAWTERSSAKGQLYLLGHGDSGLFERERGTVSSTFTRDNESE